MEPKLMEPKFMETKFMETKFMEPMLDFFPKLSLKQAVYTRVEARAPWGVDLIAYHHTKFGVITAGDCYIDLKDGEKPVRLTRGSCYLLPRGDAFRLRDKPATATVDFEDTLKNLDGRVLRLGNGNGGELTTVIGGRFIFQDDLYPPILDLLPALIHFTVSDEELNALEATLRLLAAETVSPSLGSSLMVDRLAEIFFIQSLRSIIFSDRQRDYGWVGAMAHPKLGAALRLMHNNNAHPWTISTLARQVGMSRSVFAAKFRDKVGTSPMSYLTRCRIHKAQQLLRNPSLSIEQVAVSVGYDSEAAFNKAFKRQLGVPPGRYRQAL
jgi:AraC-like DNA-binding protein